MKIRQRLALRFTLVSALLTGAILIFIFILTRGFVHADFEERLTQQSKLEVLHYATPNVKDVIPVGSFLLVNPITSIYSMEGKLLYAHGKYPIPSSWIKFVKTNEPFNAERGEYTTVGRQYNIDGNRYLVFVSDKDLPGQHELDILIRAIIVGWILSLVLSYLAGLYFSGNALEPVKHVVTEVNQITKDNLSYRLKFDKEVIKGDEIDELILTFNALLNRIESAFVAQRRFVQHASHELKTPLTAIMAEAELALARSRSVDEYQRTLEVIVLETERLVRITQGLLTLARFEEGTLDAEMNIIDVDSLINITIMTFNTTYTKQQIKKGQHFPSVHVKGNSQLLQIALLNILDNAAKYSASEIIVSMSCKDKQTQITIEDFGIGIPANELSRIRSPLFRASNAKAIAGAGLGLSLVDRIMRVHNGNLEILSEEGKGTTCIISIPLADSNSSL